MRTLLVLSLLVLCASCAKILGIEDTELQVLPAELACVGSVPEPVGNGSQIEINAFIANIATGTPIQGVRVRRCLSRLDIICDGAEIYTSDADGMVTVPVTSGFKGYLRIEDPVQDGAPTRLVTYFWYFSEAIVETRATPFPIYAMTRAYRDAAFYGGSSDHATRGEVAINVTDCSDTNAVGLHLESSSAAVFDDDTKSFYFASDLIAINPAVEETDASGLGGFVGLKPGTMNIRAVYPETGTLVATDNLLIQADVLTTVRLLPQ